MSFILLSHEKKYILIVSKSKFQKTNSSLKVIWWLNLLDDKALKLNELESRFNCQTFNKLKLKIK